MVFSPLNYFQTVCNIFLLIFIFLLRPLENDLVDVEKSWLQCRWFLLQNVYPRNFSSRVIQLLKLEFKQLNF